MQRQLARSLPLISLSLCLLGAPGYGQTNSHSRHKRIASLAGGMPLAPAVVPQVRTPALPPAQINKLAKKFAAGTYPQTHMQKGLYFKQKGQPNEALIEFIKAAQENPRNVNAFYEQAQLFKQLGKIKLAKSALEQSLAVSPKDTQARSFLVQLHFESGNFIGAASEVGKMLTLNQDPAEKTKPVEPAATPVIPASAPATHFTLPSGTPVATEGNDETSAWLGQAAGNLDSGKAVQKQAVAGNVEMAKVAQRPHSSVTTNSEPVKQAQPIIDNNKSTGNTMEDVLASIGVPEANKQVSGNNQVHTTDGAQTKPSNAVTAVIQSGFGAPSSGSTKHSPSSLALPSTPGLPATPGTVQANAAKTAETQSGILARLRSSASHAMTEITKPAPNWVKDHLPLVPQKIVTASNNSTAITSSNATQSDKQSRTAHALAWMKDKVKNTNPFAHGKDDDAADSDSPGKIASLINGVKEKLPFNKSAKSPAQPGIPQPGTSKTPLTKIAQSIKEHVPFMHHEDSNKPAPPQPVVHTTFEPSPAETLKSDLSPEVARALEGQFKGQANIIGKRPGGETKAPPPEKEKTLDQRIKQVLESVPSPPVQRETPTAMASGPTYGLLKNNALTHVGSSDPPEMADPQPSFVDNFMKQARKTFSWVPSINWSWPEFSALPGVKHASDSPDAIVASVPALKPAENAADTKDGNKNQQVAAPAPSPVPLDVSRILSKLSSPTPPDRVAAQVKLSASLPLAASPANLEDLIPKPLPASNVQAVAPFMTPQALTPSATSNAGPQTAPQPLPQNFLAQMPPMIQGALNQTQPLIKPAIDAAMNIVQSIAPLAIPKSNWLPEPVESERSPNVANTIPVPVGASMERYTPNGSLTTTPAAPDELSAGPARRLIDVQKGKSGAFTYMKPVIDSDRSYLLGGKQVRQIQSPRNAELEAKVKPIEEDAITKRMRYLLEHGTGNLRKGEFFMFSEETGEGTLFLPDGSSEHRKLIDSQSHDKIMRQRRPDIVAPKDLQYTLELLGKLLPAQQAQPNNGNGSGDPVSGPTLDQLMNQMNQNSKGFFGWMKKSLNIPN